ALGEAGEVLDLGHGDARARDGGGGRAGGDELDARGVERRRELDEAGLVVDAEERAAHGPLRVVGELDVGGGGRGMGHDEGLLWVAVAATDLTVASGRTQAPRRSTHQQVDPAAPRWSFPPSPVAAAAQSSRSEEHTSELQSRENLVCRLLLEKKKQRPTTRNRV